MSDAANNAAAGTIRRSSRTRSRKKKMNQIPFGILAFLLIVGVAIPLGLTGANLAFYWITGTIFGIVLQKSRFCFTAAMRDPYLTGGTNLAKAVLAALAITTIGFTAIKYGAQAQGLPIPGQSYVVPISFATVIGGTLFGIGMVISGGCASGTLMRVGEGFGMQILSLFFFVVGSLWGAHDFGWWKANVILKGREVFLPDVFGWLGAVLVQLAFIACLWIAADKFAKAKAKAKESADQTT